MCDKLVEEVTTEYFGHVQHESVKTHCSLRYIKTAMQELLRREREAREAGDAQDNIQIHRIRLSEPFDSSVRNGS